MEEMKYIMLLKLILVSTLFITACVPVGPASQTTELATTQPVTTEAPIVTDVAVFAPSPAPINTQTLKATSEPREPGIGDTTVKATLSNKYGLILVTDNELSLYMYKNDRQNGDSIACIEEDCTADWSPFTTEGAPVAGTGVIQELLGTISRDDGRTQVTYNGWPLYLYNGDIAAGSTKGQGMDMEWFLTSPSGDAIPE